MSINLINSSRASRPLRNLSVKLPLHHLPARPSTLKLHPLLRLRSQFHPSQQSYATSSSSSNPSYRFKDAVSDINLIWTAPISLLLGLGLWYYLQDQISSQPAQPKVHEPLPPLIVLNDPPNRSILDPSTQLEFPAELEPQNLKLTEPMRLVGLGVRTVSFLAVKVYVAGFYADPRVLRALRVIPGWSNNLSKQNFLSDHTPLKDEDDIRGESLFRNLLSAPANFAIRIAPVRPTDFTHLRDGFCRSLTARVQLAHKSGKITQADLEGASESISIFRSFFPTGVSVPKGKALHLIRTADQTLVVEYDGKKLGELNNQVIANELLLAYFADQDPISLKFKESVADGFAGLYNAAT